MLRKKMEGLSVYFISFISIDENSANYYFAKEI